VWSTVFTGFQVRAPAVGAEWHASHMLELGTWPAFLPEARVPLWHVLQAPAVTWLWSSGVNTGRHAVVLWQALQTVVVGGWKLGIPTVILLAAL